MKCLSIIFLNVRGFNVEPAANNWLTGHSGEHLSCLPNTYIEGACASARDDECSFSTIGRDNSKAETRDLYSFGIHW